MEAIGGDSDEIDIGGRSVPVRQYASWFNFKGADQQKKVGVLSGAPLASIGRGGAAGSTARTRSDVFLLIGRRRAQSAATSLSELPSLSCAP